MHIHIYICIYIYNIYYINIKIIIFCNSTISFNLPRVKLFIKFTENVPTTQNLLEGSRDFIASTSFSVCFRKIFPKGEYAKLACCFICILLKGTVSLLKRCSYSSISQMIMPIYFLLFC